MTKLNITETNKKIGKAIAKRRKACALSQEQVAEELGIGAEAVSRIERGIVIPTIERLFELAEIFDCAASDFLTGLSSRPTDKAMYLNDLLKPLSEKDQDMLIELIEKFSSRLTA